MPICMGDCTRTGGSETAVGAMTKYESLLERAHAETVENAVSRIFVTRGEIFLMLLFLKIEY